MCICRSKGRIVIIVFPLYPSIARQLGIHGTIGLRQLVISSHGIYVNCRSNPKRSHLQHQSAFLVCCILLAARNSASQQKQDVNKGDTKDPVDFLAWQSPAGCWFWASESFKESVAIFIICPLDFIPWVCSEFINYGKTEVLAFNFICEFAKVFPGIFIFSFFNFWKFKFPSLSVYKNFNKKHYEELRERVKKIK